MLYNVILNRQNIIADTGIEPVYYGYEPCVEPLQLNLQ